jgi:ubiquitin-conjugating enzyme E2 Z
MKRLAAERKRFPTESSDFFVRWNDADLREFEAYLVGPEGSLYRHKFIKLKFNIPNDYPVKPPKVTFVQHTGERIHPNLYVEGKVCLSILGTWTGPPWYAC